jgi:tellurite resistance protein TehA-like permease
MSDGDEIELSPHPPESAASVRRAPATSKLRRFPNTAVGISLGVCGNSVMWYNLASTAFTRRALGDAAHQLNWLFWVTGIVVLVCFVVAYMLKFMHHSDVRRPNCRSLDIVAYCRVASCVATQRPTGRGPRPQVVRSEFDHPVRAHFFNGPTIALCMLSLGTPAEARNVHVLRAMWVLEAVLQCALTQILYARWLFSATATLSNARPQYLLSTVVWLLLAVLAQATGLDEAWQLPLSAWVFGIGTVLYALVVIALFLGIGNAPGEKGQPALFLLLAPSSVMAMALAGFNGGVFGTASSACVGFNLAMLAVLIKLGPQLLAKPVVLGQYWAYVFPLAAFATAAIQQAQSGARGTAGDESVPAQLMAWVLVGMATCALGVVMARMSWHHMGVLRGSEVWGDPIADAIDSAAERGAAAMADSGAGAADRGRGGGATTGGSDTVKVEIYR